MAPRPELSISALLAKTANYATLAELTGLDTRLLQRRAKTGLSLEEADRCAIAVGCHPSELWPVWVDLQIERTRSERRVVAERRARAAAKRERRLAHQREYMHRYRAAHRERINAAKRDRNRRGKKKAA